jgi:hypothetical protein
MVGIVLDVNGREEEGREGGRARRREEGWFQSTLSSERAETRTGECPDPRAPVISNFARRQA